MDGLPEDAVLVAQPVPRGWELHRCHRVEEASRQPPESAVAQSGIGFLFQEADPFEVFLSDGLLRHRLKQEIYYVVGERAANEKLHGKVVDALGVLARIRVLTVQPSLRQDVSHRTSKSLEALTWTDSSRVEDIVKHQMALVQCLFGAR